MAVGPGGENDLKREAENMVDAPTPSRWFQQISHQVGEIWNSAADAVSPAPKSSRTGDNKEKVRPLSPGGQTRAPFTKQQDKWLGTAMKKSLNAWNDDVESTFEAFDKRLTGVEAHATCTDNNFNASW